MRRPGCRRRCAWSRPRRRPSRYARTRRSTRRPSSSRCAAAASSRNLPQSLAISSPFHELLPAVARVVARTRSRPPRAPPRSQCRARQNAAKKERAVLAAEKQERDERLAATRMQVPPLLSPRAVLYRLALRSSRLLG